MKPTDATAPDFVAESLNPKQRKFPVFDECDDSSSPPITDCVEIEIEVSIPIAGHRLLVVFPWAEGDPNSPESCASTRLRALSSSARATRRAGSSGKIPRSSSGSRVRVATCPASPANRAVRNGCQKAAKLSATAATGGACRASAELDPTEQAAPSRQAAAASARIMPATAPPSPRSWQG